MRAMETKPGLGHVYLLSEELAFLCKFVIVKVGQIRQSVVTGWGGIDGLKQTMCSSTPTT